MGPNIPMTINKIANGHKKKSIVLFGNFFDPWILTLWKISRRKTRLSFNVKFSKIIYRWAAEATKILSEYEMASNIDSSNLNNIIKASVYGISFHKQT